MLDNLKLRISYKKLIAFGLFGIILEVLAVYLGFKLVPDIINNKIWESKVLRENTQQWGIFQKTPFPFEFKVYFFQVKNPNQVLQGDKPIVEEVGPYAYKLFLWKTEIEWDNKTEEISYFEYTLYTFDKSASKGHSDEDYVTILNMPYNSFLLTAETTQPSVLSLLNGMLPLIFGENDGLFLRVKVKDFLFDGVRLCDKGGEEKGFAAKLACKQVKTKALTARNMRVLDDGSILFAMLHYKNMTHLGRFQVKSGKSVREESGLLTRYNNQTHVSAWNGERSSCNRIRGITSIFPANVQTDMIFESFAEDICRTIAMEFKDTQTVKDIKGYKFSALNNSLANPTKNNANECYCVNKTIDLDGSYGCLGDGLLDLTTCTGASLVMSFPHLLGADPKYTIEGLRPDQDKHETFVILEPASGFPMKLAKRVQFNMFIRPVQDITSIENVTTNLVPVVWVEESTTLDDRFMDMIKSSVLKYLTILKIVRWSFVAIGIIVVVLSLVLFIYIHKRDTYELKKK